VKKLPAEMSLQKNLARQFRVDSGALCARVGPIPLEAALSALAWQNDLAAPAKFAISRISHNGSTAEILAEIPSVAERFVCEKLADAALDAALVGPLEESGPPDPSQTAFSDEELESALSQLPWGFRQRDAGSYQIDAAPAPGHALRVMLTAQGAALRASTATSVRAGSPEALRALAYFALESNARLRLARISVREKVGEGKAGADIVWDAVAPGTLPVGAIAPIVEAVVYAQMFTRRSLSVLADPRMAAAYLRDRPAARAGKSSKAGKPGKRARQQPTGRTSKWMQQPQAIS
jgi:hypothetical protein